MPERLFACEARDLPLLDLRRGPGIRPPLMPFMVTFADIAAPTSVEALDPYNLAASLGNGISLRRISIEITRDDVTERVKYIIPWLEDYRSRHLKLDGVRRLASRPTAPLEARLSAESFSMEI